nr:MAG TPA: hypothetical protein [Bacteriophage sp.]
MNIVIFFSVLSKICRRTVIFVSWRKERDLKAK